MANHDRIIQQVLPKELQHFTDRELRWLWKIMTPNFNLPEEKSLGPSQRALVIKGAIENSESPQAVIQKILISHSDQVIGTHYLQWIDKNDQRLLIWLLHQLSLHSQTSHSGITTAIFMTIPSEIRYQEILRIIDTWLLSCDAKILWLSQKKAEWSQIRSTDSQTKWLALKNSEQLVWAWEYLRNHSKAVVTASPVTDDEFHAAILASIDWMSYGHQAEKRVFIDQMKKSWSQKKYRDSGKAKKPYIFPLTKDVIAKLDWLARHHGIKPVTVLESLICTEYTQESSKPTFK